MFVIVAGIGAAGMGIIRILTARKHDVIAIDINREHCEKIYAETGITTINGNATDIGILREAKIDKADVLVCLMHSDTDNIACSLLSKSFGVGRIVARLREPVYEQAYRLAGVSSPLRVDDLLFNEIINEVEQPKARKIMEISKNRANVYAVEIEHNSRSIGLTIVDITSEGGFPRDVVFMGIFRNRRKDFLIPHGDTRLMEGDLVFVVSNDSNIKKATSLLTDPLS